MPNFVSSILALAIVAASPAPASALVSGTDATAAQAAARFAGLTSSASVSATRADNDYAGSAADGGDRDTGWAWPLLPRPEVADGFDPPADDYAAGHRGTDLVGSSGATVYAVAGGEVTYAGSVAGIEVVTIDHGGTKSTYQPVDAQVHRGDQVSRGQAIGSLLPAPSHCAPRTCLHLGRIVDDEYADPLALMTTASRVRLVSPLGPPPAPSIPPGPSGSVPSGDGRLVPPVEGPITSPFGMRVHPITGVYKLHDGTDFGVACGTPVHAAESGVVTAAYYDGAYGNRVIVDHGTIDGSGVTTSYNHLSSATVVSGTPVTSGQIVGAVGSTGYSTGCHLHFMVETDGSPTDPQAWL